MNAPRCVDIPRYKVFYLTPKTHEVTKDLKNPFLFGQKKMDPSQLMSSIFKKGAILKWNTPDVSPRFVEPE